MLSMFDVCVPPSLRTLAALRGMLDKAAAHAAARGFEPSVLLGSRLYPDMFALSRQVQITADFAKGGVARLTGAEAPKMADTETTIPELQARLDRTVAFIETATPGAFEGSETREVVLKVGGHEMRFDGKTYLLHFVLPNLYFHATAAYAILRHNGVEVGKRDYVGAIPGLT